jgi:hypothetical protein
MSRPRLFLTETATPRSASSLANRLTAESDGRSYGMPAAAFKGMRLTFDLTPANKRLSVRASSGESLTRPVRHTQT